MYKSTFLRKLMPLIAVALLTVAIIFNLTFSYLLRGTLYTAAEDDFIQHAQIYSMIIEEHMDKLKSTALQIGSRTQIRNRLQMLEQGESTLDDAVLYIQPKLNDAVVASSDVSGVAWLNSRGEMVVTAGDADIHSDPSQLAYRTDGDAPLFYGPIYSDNRTYISITTKIWSTNNEMIGYNIVYFPTLKLEQLIKRKLHEHDDLKLLGYDTSFFGVLDLNTIIEDHSPIMRQLNLIDPKAVPADGIYIDSDDYAIGFIPVVGTPWYIASSQSYSDLHAPLLRLLFLVSILVFVMVGIAILVSWRIILISVKEVDKYQKELETTNNSLTTSLKELKQAQEQLIRRETLAALGELVGGLMHELNTPLGSAVTSLSYLDSEVRDLTKASDQDITHYEEAYSITTKNLEKAITNIETFRILNMDQATLEMRRINIADYIGEILLSLKPKLKVTQHKVEVQCEKDLHIVTTPGILSQVLTNLITNSLKHGFEDIQSGLIMIDVSKSGQDLLIKYSDNGVGIPQENINHVFEPYFTTKRHDGGTGLGLHIIYSLVTQQLKGTIDIKSTVGQGTTFDIKFPVG